ncbi:MAG: hypothetical protein ACE5HU_06895 [Acidobacteriota bacterium]
MKRTWVFLVVPIPLLALFSSWPGGPGAAAAQAPEQTTKRRLLPEQDPNFQRLLERLADRADLYRKSALGFTCREVVLQTKYDIETSGYRKSSRTMYDYLFERRPNGKLRELRERLVDKGNGKIKRRRADFDPPVPPAYMWSSIFARENRGRFHFRPAGQVVRAYRLLNIINFIGTAPNPGGAKISGWSGQVAVDEKTLNLWSVRAEPSGQDVRLEVEIRRYNKAFAIAGVPLASRPHGWRLDVTFGFELKGLSYPTEQVLSMTSLSRSQRMNVEKKISFRYERYRFFGVGVEAEVTGTEDTTEHKP